MQTVNDIAFQLNGRRVKRVKDTIFVPLPRELWRECGPCACPVCKERKSEHSYWDTLAISANATGNDFTWTVHFPELHS